MKLIDILKERVSNNNYDNSICGYLYTKVVEIITNASDHLEYVRNVLDEFDKHNAKHSEAVLDIIEKLLGEKAKDLSSYDLFSLIAVSYLHDCGMAVSDFEINVMKLIENDGYDGKKVCTNDESYALIDQNRVLIYKSENDAKNVKDWLFYPGSEEKLFDYYSQLLIDYQNYRNGKIDVIRKSNDKVKKNKELRVDYIRRTHAERVETYIKFWGETEFVKFLGGNIPMGKELIDNIAMACKAHNEDASYLLELDNNVGYLGDETSNLQFVAMMLRIGDIVHFSYDRAPVVLRALHHFESSYSYEQWRKKTDSGVNYSIKDCEIIFKANCNNPKDYYDLMGYIDCVDNELALYNRTRFEEKWDECYPVLPKDKVNRVYIKHAKSFIPVPNLKFTLDQNRILDLLMGAELYSDEYACIRELYQNSLDACRCQIAKDRTNDKVSKGKIEFGIITDGEGNKYVYCLDNGKGMSKYIIEHYLLKIGSSYYQSADFYQYQAATGNTFTPTSQFGIGILSCFMIGDKIEITTKEEGGEYISCVMENFHECFYYKKEISNKDKEVIASSGTLIKIFLNEKYKDKMSNEHLENIGYLLWKKEHSSDNKYSYTDHLYFILDGFVKVVPTSIELNVKMNDGETLQVFCKPQPMGKGVFMLPNDRDSNYYHERIEETVFLDLDVENDGIQYRTYLVLPTDKTSYFSESDVLFGRSSYCVDGIRVEDGFVKGGFLNKTGRFGIKGVLNFMGSERPQLSISREKIVNYEPNKYEEKIKGLLSKLIKQAIDKIVNHIVEHHIRPESDHYYNIWNSFLRKFDDVPAYMVTKYFKENPIKDLFMPLPQDFTSSKMTFGEFMSEEVCFENYRLYGSEGIMGISKLMQSIIIDRINFSKNISWDGANVLIKGYELNNMSEFHMVPVSGGIFADYDIVPDLYPFVSDSLYKFMIHGQYDTRRLRELYSFALSFIAVLTDCVLSSIEDNLSGLLKRELSVLERDYWEIIRKERIVHHYPDVYTYLSDFFNKNKALLLSQFEPRVLEGIAIALFVPITTELLNSSSFRRYYPSLSDFPSGPRLEKGLSVVLFEGEDFYVIPGRHSRRELVNKMPYNLWTDLHRDEYRFADGKKVRVDMYDEFWRGE